MDKDTALKLALEALEANFATWSAKTKAIPIIKEALSQPEQKPVANGIIRTLVSIDKDGIETWKHEPFYTAPPQREWVGLTGPEVVEAYRSVIAAEEREACAKVCESLEIPHPDTIEGLQPDYVDGKRMAVMQCAAAIRARGNE